MFSFKELNPSLLLLSGLGLPLLAAAVDCGLPGMGGPVCNSRVMVIQGKNGWYAQEADACWQKIAAPRELSLKNSSTGEERPCLHLQGIKAYDVTCDINLFAYENPVEPRPGESLSISQKWYAGDAEWTCGGQPKEVWGLRQGVTRNCPENCEACKGDEKATGEWLWQW